MKIMGTILFTLLSLASAFAHESLSDKDFDQWLSESPEAIVYVWSPFMPLSVLGRADILAIGEDLHIPVLTVVDPFADGQLLGDSSLQAEQLLSKGALDHFPAVFVIHHNELLPGVIHGYEEKTSLTNMILQKLNTP